MKKTRKSTPSSATRAVEAETTEAQKQAKDQASEIPKLNVVVSGDPAVDWVIAKQRSEQQRTTGIKRHWREDREEKVQGHAIPGGACLLAELVKEVCTSGFNSPWIPDWPPVRSDMGSTELSQHYATLLKYPLDIEEERVHEIRLWRVEKYLGETIHNHPKNREGWSISNDPGDARLVVLNDSGLDYHKDKQRWPLAIKGKSQIPPWVLLKTGGNNTATGGLWDLLRTSHKDRLIVVTTADDLRSMPGVEISHGLSWERTAGDCATAVKNSLPGLAECAYVVVSFGRAGVMIFNRDGDQKFTLFFDPSRLEGDIAFRKHGRMWGYTSALTAAIARQLMNYVSQKDQNDRPDTSIRDAVRTGLAAMDKVYECGFVEGEGIVDFPKKAVAKVIIDGENLGIFGEVSFNVSPSFHAWSIIGEKYAEGLQDLAKEVVTTGPTKALPNAPRGEYHNLVTVDRQEIEGFQSIRGLVRDYALKRTKQKNRSRSAKAPAPLSVAVFGAPGSGKSWAVRELINSLGMPEVDFKHETFNLSQFRSVSDLEDSLHLVRDDGLMGQMPVVFWDEFDAYFERNLGWLRYFLSPMEDGTFQQGQAVHPIGRSIFVFAGGISSSLQEFQDLPDFAYAKGPDFLSRLRGSLELRGIDAEDGDTEKDPYYIIRRAVLLNAILKAETTLLDGPGISQKSQVEIIDPGVLRAFLTVKRYTHGVRSMKAIVATSSLAGKDYFGRSDLPAQQQLKLHVDARDFLSKVREAPPPQ